MDRRIVSFLILMVLSLFSLTFADEKCEGSGISPNGSKQDTGEVTIKKGTTRKNRMVVEDIEIAKVKWSANLETNKEFFVTYDLSTLKLEFKTDGEWKSHTPTKKPEFTGYYEWNVPRIPCLRYEYQIVVSSTDGSKCFSTKAASLEPENKTTIRASRFTPDPPTDLVINTQSNHANIMWNKSACAEEYEVYVEEPQTDGQLKEDSKTFHETVNQPSGNENKAKAEFPNLKPCSNYQIEIFPKVKRAEEGNKFHTDSFYTKPDVESASYLDLNETSSTKSSVTLTFSTGMPRVNCLKNFDIQTCSSEKNCDQMQKFTGIHNHEKVKYTSDDLEHCSNYFLKVQPTYEGIDIKEKEVKVTTKFDEATVSVPTLNPGTNDVNVVIRNTDCLESFETSYRLKGGSKEGSGSDHVWEKRLVKIDTNIINIDNLQPNSTYQMNMSGVTSGGSKKVSIFELKEFKTLSEGETRKTTNNIHQENSETTKSDADGFRGGFEGGFNKTSTEIHGTTTGKGAFSDNTDNGVSTDGGIGNGEGNLTKKEDGGSGTIIAIVVILVVVIGAAVGYWFIRRKKSGDTNVEGAIATQTYSEVHVNEQKADNAEQEPVQ